MKLIIHRGTHEIGGTCVELITENNCIVVDFGMPLVSSKNGQPFDSKILEGKSIEELKKSGDLPGISGLYRGEAKQVDAILISHSHMDHYGLLKYVHPDIPIYMSQGAKALIEISDVFIPNKVGKINSQVVAKYQKKVIGDFTVTPYLVDHSAFDALAFLIEADGKRLFYSGDFRASGWKGRLFDRFIAKPPRDIDCLLMEGTMIDRGAGKYPTERAILNRMIEILRETQKNIVFVCCSGQNIDRLVTFYKAARETKSSLVVDPYTACVLSSIKSPQNKIPQIDWKGVRVFMANYYGKGDVYIKRISEGPFKSLIPNLGRAKIKPQDFQRLNQKAIFLMRVSMIPALEKIPDINGAKLVYSLWKKYLERDSAEVKKLYAFIDRYNLDLEFVHASGHAVSEDLKTFAKALAPKVLIPIHTQHPREYKKFFENVFELQDNEPFDLGEI